MQHSSQQKSLLLPFVWELGNGGDVGWEWWATCPKRSVCHYRSPIMRASMHRKEIHQHLTSKRQTLESNSPSGLYSGGNGVILGPYFFDGNVNGLAYLRILNEFAFPQLAVHFKNQFREGLFRGLWWAQDGAPVHRLIEVQHRFNEVFSENRVIALQHNVEWPPRLHV